MANFKLSTKQILLLKSFYEYFVQWSLLSTLVGVLVGLVSAFFLVSLEFVTTTRENYVALFYFLPLAGLLSGFAYHYYGQDVNKGIKLLINEYHISTKKIPFKMAPMVLFGTLLTHLFGGSAGREGTAVQMGGAIADQFYPKLRATSLNRKIVLLLGISAGFGSVFGTPLAGTLFAFELMRLKKVPYQAIFPTLLAALVANQTCIALGIKHHDYFFAFTSVLAPLLLFKTVCIGILCGLVAIVFIKSTHAISILFSKIPVPKQYIPFIGAILFVVLILLIGDPKYMGLGTATIAESFKMVQSGDVFLLKIFFTALTLGVGFKGGEVTPLFFIGATFGSFIAAYMGVELNLAAAIGFIAVFSGATKTPIACIIMGIELFGIALAPYLLVACFAAHYTSGKHTIYN